MMTLTYARANARRAQEIEAALTPDAMRTLMTIQAMGAREFDTSIAKKTPPTLWAWKIWTSLRMTEEKLARFNVAGDRQAEIFEVLWQKFNSELDLQHFPVSSEGIDLLKASVMNELGGFAAEFFSPTLGHLSLEQLIDEEINNGFWRYRRLARWTPDQLSSEMALITRTIIKRIEKLVGQPIPRQSLKRVESHRIDEVMDAILTIMKSEPGRWFDMAELATTTGFCHRNIAAAARWLAEPDKMSQKPLEAVDCHSAYVENGKTRRIPKSAKHSTWRSFKGKATLFSYAPTITATVGSRLTRDAADLEFAKLILEQIGAGNTTSNRLFLTLKSELKGVDRNKVYRVVNALIAAGFVVRAPELTVTGQGDWDLFSATMAEARAARSAAKGIDPLAPKKVQEVIAVPIEPEVDDAEPIECDITDVTERERKAIELRAVAYVLAESPAYIPSGETFWDDEDGDADKRGRATEADRELAQW